MVTTTQTTPSLEQRIATLETLVPKLAALAGTQTAGKLSTRFVGVLTAIATGVGYVVSSGILTPQQSAVVGLVAGGITAYLAAEET
jgi:hypothetical protein